MTEYQAPALSRVGTVTEVTQGTAYSEGQDNLSWVPIFGQFFGGDDYPGPFGS